jgi:hypothetical protein
MEGTNLNWIVNRMSVLTVFGLIVESVIEVF